MHKFLTKTNIFIAIVLAIYFLIGAFMIAHVEPWIDETNTWQIAKVLTPENFFEVYRVEPHPVLWTLIQLPFAKLGFSIFTINFISLVIMTIALYIFLRHAPFPPYVKLVVALSSVFLYFLPVLARDYCLVALGLMAVASIYYKRFKSPIKYALALALLLQGHYLVSILAGFLAIDFFLGYIKQKNTTRKTQIQIICIIAISLLLNIICVAGPFIYNYLPDRFANYYPRGVASYSELPFSYLAGANNSLFGTSLPIIEIAVLTFGLYLLFRYPKVFAIFAVSTVSHILLLSYVYASNGDTRKDILLLLYFVFATWLIYGQKPTKRRLQITKTLSKLEIVKLLLQCKISQPARACLPMMILCCATIPALLSITIWDIGHSSYPSVAAANYINTLPNNAVIVALEHHSDAISLVPMLTGSRGVYDPVEKTPLKYIAYDGFRDMPNEQELLKLVQQTYPQERPIYFIRAKSHMYDFEPPSYATDPIQFLPDESDFSTIRASQITIFQFNQPH